MKDIYEHIKKISESKFLFKILGGIIIVVVALFIFYVGFNVGFRKASFGHAWEENYERNFGFEPSNGGLSTDNFPNANGAIGKIIKVELPTVIVADKDNTEKVILIKTDTQIQKMRTNIMATDLKVGDFIIVIGAPNAQGQIEAKFIRVMPVGIPIPPTQ